MVALCLGVFVAGGLGSLVRWGLSTWVQSASGSEFPWGTALVNVLGAFLFGIVYAAAVHRGWISPEMRTVVLTGFLGGLTTFSTLAFESTSLMADGFPVRGVLNYLGQGVLGIAAVWLGMGVLGRLES